MTHIRFAHGDGHIVARAHSPRAWAPLALVAGALGRIAHAYAHGQGRPVEHGAHWVVLAPGAVAAQPHPEAYFLADDDTCTPERAALLARRVRTAMRSARATVADEERDHPLACVAVPGVPGGERDTVCALSMLALEAACELSGPVDAHSLRLACALRTSGETPDDACAGLVATRLDRPEALEAETRAALVDVAAALIDSHRGLADWIPRHRDPTVRLRTPAGAPGLALVFVPFVVTTGAARRAFERGELIERALAQCAPHPFAATPMH